jgi:hypothetical protein
VRSLFVLTVSHPLQGIFQLYKICFAPATFSIRIEKYGPVGVMASHVSQCKIGRHASDAAAFSPKSMGRSTHRFDAVASAAKLTSIRLMPDC